jgi:hypothetical protein
MREDVKRVSGNGIREVGDDSDAVSGVRSLVERCVNGWGCERKSRGRIRT